MIDLSRMNCEADSPIRLDGEWKFYWKQLLSPQDLRGPQVPDGSGYLTLPGSWNSFVVKGQKIGGQGYGTLRLRILPPPGRQILAIQIGLVNSAYRLWAGDQLLVENGTIGTDAGGETPIQSFRQLLLHSEGRPIELVLQLSNYHDREGGVVSSMTFGPPDKLEAQRMRRRALSWIVIGSLMIMGIYHLFLYLFRTKNAAPLYFGMYCLLWMMFFLTNDANGWLVRMFVGDIPAWLLNRIDLICLVLSVPILYSFLRTLYPREFSFRLQQGTWIAALIFMVPGLAASSLVFTSVIPFYYVFCIALICYMFVILGKAIRAQRDGSLYLLLGFSGLGLVAVNDMLYDLQLIRSFYLMEAGMLGFILFQACALSMRYSRAFASVEQLSGQLADKNAALEREMAERTGLEREIVNTSEEERRLISRELHDGLCQKLTGARLRFSVLSRKLEADNGQAEALSSVSTLLEESVHQAYDLSRGLWPVEHNPHGVSPSLEELSRRLSESSGIAIEFSQKRGCEKCTNTALIQLYRIAQEAITNAVKHARPEKIAVALDCAGRQQITLTVEDNGIGRSSAPPPAGGLGISIMAHRARIIGGTLSIADAESRGTVVSCVAPCTPEGSRDCKGTLII